MLTSSFINEYVQNKLYTDTGSLDYSSSRFTALISPTTLFGDGIMMYSNGQQTKDVGLINTIFYLIFLLSTLFYSVKLIWSKSNVYSLIGCGVLYYYFHSFKLTNSIFVMPATIYILCVLYANLNKSKYEGATCNN